MASQRNKKSRSRTLRVPEDLDRWIDELPPDVLGPYYAQKALAMLYKAKRLMEEESQMIRQERNEDGDSDDKTKRSESERAL